MNEEALRLTSVGRFESSIARTAAGLVHERLETAWVHDLLSRSSWEREHACSNS